MTSNLRPIPKDSASLVGVDYADLEKSFVEGEYITRASWSTAYPFIKFRRNGSYLNMTVLDKNGYATEVSTSNMQIYFKQFTEMKYVPSQEGDKEDDI